jgi:hypothetical protein
MTAPPTLGLITRRDGVAGQVMFFVTVSYPDEPTSLVTFSGSIYGGPVVMITESGQTFVTNPERFGEFGREWVRRFFA